MEKIKHLLHKAGLKATKSRIDVLALLIEEHKPLSIEDIQKKLHKNSPDRVTLYRMMSQYYHAHIVSRVDFREGFERFEFQDHHHHHMVCTDCGIVEEFELCEAAHISHKVLSLSKKFSFIKDHSLELFGVCKTCARV